MLFSTPLSIAALSLFSLSSAQPVAPPAADDAAAAAPSVYITVWTNVGTKGNHRERLITVPLGTLYTDEEAFAEVSTLYIRGTDSSSLLKDDVACIPYKDEAGTQVGGETLTWRTPSYLSTNTVKLGSLLCNRK